MPDLNILSFDEAVRATDGRPRHILLGNGFSRALYNDIFSYDALFERADFSALSPTARQAFSALETTDFEQVMRSLQRAARLVGLYSPDTAELAGRLTADAIGLRTVLAQTIADHHPEGPFEVTDEQCASCRRFLSNFKNIYTVNYDLLLYWVLMRQELEPEVPCDDGFRQPDEGEADYVTWDVEKTDGQNVHYLHGALHLFDARTSLKKYAWCNTGIRLIQQIREALDQDLFPLIVAEGTSPQKLERIMHSNYLSRSYRSLVSITGSLFLYGHSMHENDAHILDLVRRNKSVRQILTCPSKSCQS